MFRCIVSVTVVSSFRASLKADEKALVTEALVSAVTPNVPPIEGMKPWMLPEADTEALWTVSRETYDAVDVPTRCEMCLVFHPLLPPWNSYLETKHTVARVARGALQVQWPHWTGKRLREP